MNSNKLKYFDLVNQWDIICPQCKSEVLEKYGKYKDTQRYRCLSCNITFTPKAMTPLDGTHYTINEWQALINGMLEHKSLRELEHELGINYITLYTWQNKILDAIEESILKKIPYLTHQALRNVKYNDPIEYYLYKQDSNYKQFCHLLISSYNNQFYTLRIDDDRLKNINKRILNNTKNSTFKHQEYLVELIAFLSKYKRSNKVKLQKLITFFDVAYNNKEHGSDELLRIVAYTMYPYKK